MRNVHSMCVTFRVSVHCFIHLSYSIGVPAGHTDTIFFEQAALTVMHEPAFLCETMLDLIVCLRMTKSISAGPRARGPGSGSGRGAADTYRRPVCDAGDATFRTCFAHVSRCFAVFREVR